MSDSIHVIGAGFAGAAAAVKLAAAGERVVLWEARRHPGGRTSTLTDPESGEVLDNGPHLLMGCYSRTLALLDALGTRERLTFQRRLTIPIVTPEGRTGLSCPGLPAPWFLVVGLIGMGQMSLTDRLSLARTGHALKGGARPGESVAAFLRRSGATAKAVHLLWDPLCRAVTNLTLEEAGAGPFVTALRIALLGSAEDARLGWVARLDHLLIDDGESRLAAYLAARGGEVRRGRVRAIVCKGGRVTGIIGPDEKTIGTGRVVVATDPYGAAALLSDTPASDAVKQALSGLRHAPIVSVYLWYDRPVVALTGEAPFIGLAGGQAEWVFDRDMMAGNKQAGPQRLATITSVADGLARLRASDVVTQVVADIERYFPRAREATLTHARVVKEGRATVRLGPDTPRPAPGPVDGVDGLYLAGDYTDTGLPCTIEGAVRSGEAAVPGAQP